MIYWKKINNPKNQIYVYLRKNLLSIIFSVLIILMYIFKLPYTWIQLFGFSKTISIVIVSIIGCIAGILILDLFVKVFEDVNWLKIDEN